MRVDAEGGAHPVEQLAGLATFAAGEDAAELDPGIRDAGLRISFSAVAAGTLADGKIAIICIAACGSNLARAMADDRHGVIPARTIR